MTRKSAIYYAGLVATALIAKHVAAGDQEEQARTDRLLNQAQRICPVTGKDLLSMGGPIKAKVGEESIFLCCKGCFQRKIDKQHWNQMQANLMHAQGKCPVMGNPLPKNPTSLVVSGRKVFVCCPPCTQKIKTDPNKYLSLVNKFLEENLAKQARRSVGGRLQ